jgi:hypothetical protein
MLVENVFCAGEQPDRHSEDQKGTEQARNRDAQQIHAPVLVAQSVAQGSQP